MSANGLGVLVVAMVTVHRSLPHSIEYAFNPRTDLCLQNTVAQWEEKMRNLSELAAKTEERKKTLREGRGSRADILKASESLKRINHEIAATRRFLEPLAMSCPFCLWDCAPLFVADDAEAAGQREAH